MKIKKIILKKPNCKKKSYANKIIDIQNRPLFKQGGKNMSYPSKFSAAQYSLNLVHSFFTFFAPMLSKIENFK